MSLNLLMESRDRKGKAGVEPTLRKHREAAVTLTRETVGAVARPLEVTEQFYYR